MTLHPKGLCGSCSTHSIWHVTGGSNAKDSFRNRTRQCEFCRNVPVHWYVRRLLSYETSNGAKYWELIIQDFLLFLLCTCALCVCACVRVCVCPCCRDVCKMVVICRYLLLKNTAPCPTVRYHITPYHAMPCRTLRCKALTRTLLYQSHRCLDFIRHTRLSGCAAERATGREQEQVPSGPPLHHDPHLCSSP